MIHVPIRPGATVTDDDARSVTPWIKNLGTADRDEAFRHLWVRYVPRLDKVALARVRTKASRHADDEDTARKLTVIRQRRPLEQTS